MRSCVTNLSLSLKVGRGGGRGRSLRNRRRNLSLAQLLVRDWRGWGFVAVSKVQSEIGAERGHQRAQMLSRGVAEGVVTTPTGTITPYRDGGVEPTGDDVGGDYGGGVLMGKTH